MSLWRQQQGSGPADWDAWLSATYQVYEQTIPHIDVASTPWWAAVVETGLADGVPDRVRSAVTIMDAMARQEGQRLWDAVEPTLGGGHALPASMRALAGLVALELLGADAERRKAYAKEHMGEFGEEETSGGFGFRVIKAYAERE
jgi:hypothetical protein